MALFPLKTVAMQVRYTLVYKAIFRGRRRRNILHEYVQTRKYGLKSELPGARTQQKREFSRKIKKLKI